MHQIGVGVLGPVYRCYDPDRDRLVALKAFHLDLTPEQADTLARALQAVAEDLPVHPGVVSPVGAGLADGVPYLAQAYVAAESLDVAIRHYAPASEEMAGLFLRQLAEALDLAHGADLCHGALHLRDVFVSRASAQVTGLGVVPALEQVGLRGPLRRPYTAPEQIAGEAWGPAADRFALAAVAFELLTGKRVAGARTDVEPLAMTAGRDAIRLGRLFEAALADEPTARPGTASGFIDDLADALGWSGTDLPRSVLSEPTEPAGAALLAVGAETDVVSNEGATEMARAKRPIERDAGSLDWTERPLDRGESESLRADPEYQPREPGNVRPTRRAEPEFDEIDALLAGCRPVVSDEEGVGDEAVPPDTDDGGEYDDGTVSASARLSDEAPYEVDGAVGGHEATLAGPSSWDEDWGESAHEEAGFDEESEATDEQEVELEVIQARYRSGAGTASAAAVRPEPDFYEDEEEDDEEIASEPLPAYEPIRLDPPEARAQVAFDDDPDATLDLPADEPVEDPSVSEPRIVPRMSPTPAGYRMPVAQSEEPAEELFELEPEHSPLAASESSDYPPISGDDEVDDEDVTAGAMPPAWQAEGRRMPWAVLGVVAVVIMAAAFAVGFGWMSGDGSGAAEDTEASVADPAPTLASAGDLGEVRPTEPVAAVPDVPVSSDGDGQTFSEAVVETPTASVAPPPAPEPAAPPPPAPAPRAARPAPPLAPAPRPAPAVVVEGRLLVRSTPPGVAVAVDGAPRGQTPLALAGLAAGSYQVRLSMDGYELDERQVVISEDDPIASLDATLTPLPEAISPGTAPVGVGSIFVDTRPRGSEVWLDRQLVGETPMLIPNVSPGVHDVEFRQDGYRAWATTVEVGPAGQARVTASLDHAR